MVVAGALAHRLFSKGVVSHMQVATQSVGVGARQGLPD
jgi:hypothetical protein